MNVLARFPHSSSQHGHVADIPYRILVPNLDAPGTATQCTNLLVSNQRLTEKAVGGGSALLWRKDAVLPAFCN